MARGRLVTGFAEVKANIDRYERELAKSKKLQEKMSYARSWHGYLASDGNWRVAPSKFVGYVDNNAATYLRFHRERDGRRTERALSSWFDAVEPGSAVFEDITAAVLRLFAQYDRAPNKLLRVNAPKQERSVMTHRQNVWKPDRALLRERITFDPKACSGRPCIRGMRIRVKDVLDMLAAGATREEILGDYPYLEDDDISAALQYAAESADHRVVSVA